MAKHASFADFLKDPNANEMLTRVALERVPFYDKQRFDRTALNGLRVDVLDEMEGAVLRLSAYIWAEVLQNERVTLDIDESGSFEASWPATWWEHVKQRWFPRWALARWPVRMEVKRETWCVKKSQTHKFRTVALLPHFKYEPPRGCGEAFVLRTMVDHVA